MKNSLAIFVLFTLGTLMGCGSSGDDPINEINLISITLNGGELVSGAQDVPIDAELSLVFGSVIDPTSFEGQFTISGNGSYTLSYTNGSTRVIIETSLEYDTKYGLRIGTGAIGENGERLSTELNYDFSTAEDGIIRALPPCTDTGACLRSTELTGSTGLGTFEFYSNYPIYEEDAAWENLTGAVIVVHGASHNPNDYFSWMTSTLQSEGLSDETILIAPFFRDVSTGSSEDFFWSNTNWRRGQPSSNDNKLSSFEAIDFLIDQLANTERFPVLEKIVVTGHSSGAAFTHVFSGANVSEDNHPSIDFEYIVANSQFFYYPDGQRINETTNQLFTPDDCAGYTVWPLGYDVKPPYLLNVNVETFNDQFAGRKVTYLLGNGNQADPTFNATNCENTLQGSSRYQRGENIFRYMELVYPDTHNHSRNIVNGIGHDGQGMYQSSEFRSLLLQLLD